VPRPGEYYLLLYLNNIAKKTQDIAFQASSTDGKLLATAKINPGNYQVLNPYFLHFSRNYLYAALEKKGGDGSQFFARVNLEGEPASRFPVASPWTYQPLVKIATTCRLGRRPFYGPR
jgi:hypothetical protein